MQDQTDNKLNFVLRHYREDKFDTKKAISQFHAAEAERTAPRLRWAVTFATAFASLAIVFAAGYGITKAVNQSKEPVKVEIQQVLNPDVATTHEFVYDDAPLQDVLQELSDYFGCTLTSSPTRKHLTATFPDDDLEVIVSIIESVLDVDITVEKR